jgi:hypothetical protein
LDSVSVRIDDLVKDRRPPKAAALRAVLDKIINANNWQPSDQGRHPISWKCCPDIPLDAASGLLYLTI